MFDPVTEKASIWTTSSFVVLAGAVLPADEAAGAGAVESWACNGRLGKAAKAKNKALGRLMKRELIPGFDMGGRC
jgi:hypothetical protein